MTDNGVLNRQIDGVVQGTVGSPDYEDRTQSAHFCAATNNVKALQSVLQKKSSQLNKQDAEGKTPLFYAVANHHVEAIKVLLDHKAKLNLTDSTGQVSLHIAAFDGFSEGVKLLLDHGAKPYVRDVNGRIPLHLATNSPDIKCLTTLLFGSKQDQVNVRDLEGMTALHWAAFHKRPNHVRILLSKGAQEEIIDVDKKSPLHWASQNGSPMCCQMLIMSKSARLVNETDKNGNSCLHLAAAGGYGNVVKVLARVNAVVMDARDNNGRTALHWAAAAGHDKACEALLNLNCNPNIKDNVEKRPIDYARNSRTPTHRRCVKMLKFISLDWENGQRVSRRQIPDSDSKSSSLATLSSTGLVQSPPPTHSSQPQLANYSNIQKKSQSKQGGLSPIYDRETKPEKSSSIIKVNNISNHSASPPELKPVTKHITKSREKDPDVKLRSIIASLETKLAEAQVANAAKDKRISTLEGHVQYWKTLSAAPCRVCETSQQSITVSSKRTGQYQLKKAPKRNIRPSSDVQHGFLPPITH
eukprot:m.8160 g.8160  ORF g.8160 m.8160 type:complete len:527 (-) comp3848_c0_seq2:116-1696(-)